MFLSIVFIDFSVLNECCTWNGVCPVSVVFVYLLLIVCCGIPSQGEVGVSGSSARISIQFFFFVSNL